MSCKNSNLSLYNSKYLKYKNKYLGLKKMFGGGLININITYENTTRTHLIYSTYTLMPILQSLTTYNSDIFPYYNNKLITKEGNAESYNIQNNSTIIIYLQPQPKHQSEHQTKPQEKLSYDKDKVEQIDTDKELLKKVSRYYNNNKITDANWIYYNYHENKYKHYEYNHSEVFKSIQDKYYPIHREYVTSLEEPGILKKLLELNIQIDKDTKEVEGLVQKLSKYYHNNRITEKEWIYQLIYMHGDEYKTIRDFYYPKHSEYVKSLKEPGTLYKLLALNIQIEEEKNNEYNKEENVKKRADETERQKADAIRHGWGSQYRETREDIEANKNRPPLKPCFCKSQFTCNCK